MTDFTKFEIVTTEGLGFRYPTDKYHWRYAVEGECHDIEIKSEVEILAKDLTGEYEDEVIQSINNVSLVGFVTPDVCMSLEPMKMQTRCTKCGFMTNKG